MFYLSIAVRIEEREREREELIFVLFLFESKREVETKLEIFCQKKKKISNKHNYLQLIEFSKNK